MKKKLTNEDYTVYCTKCKKQLDLKDLFSKVWRIHDEFGDYLDEKELLEVLTDCNYHE